LWGAFRLIWKNIFLLETVCRLEKDLSIPDKKVEPAIPLDIEIVSNRLGVENWPWVGKIHAIRGDYGVEQFHNRFGRGDLCFAASSEGIFVGFVWLEFPPGAEAGYPLYPEEAYTYDGWVFENYRGKRALPYIQQAIMDYVRAHHKDIRRLVTHVATWNKYSLFGDQRAGYIVRRLERTVMIFGIHTKQILDRDIPVDVIMHQG